MTALHSIYGQVHLYREELSIKVWTGLLMGICGGSCIRDQLAVSCRGQVWVFSSDIMTVYRDSQSKNAWSAAWLDELKISNGRHQGNQWRSLVKVHSSSCHPVLPLHNSHNSLPLWKNIPFTSFSQEQGQQCDTILFYTRFSRIFS